jgi:hypothetical protein
MYDLVREWLYALEVIWASARRVSRSSTSRQGRGKGSGSVKGTR